MENLFFVLGAFVMGLVALKEVCWIDYLNDFGEPSELKTGARVYTYFLVLIILFVITFIPMKLLDLFDFNLDWLDYILTSASTLGFAGFALWYSNFLKSVFQHQKDKDDYILQSIDKFNGQEETR